VLQETGNLEPPETTEVQKSRKLYQYLVSENDITVLQLILRHCDITRNEKADVLAKKATLITETTDREMYLLFILTHALTHTLKHQLTLIFKTLKNFLKTFW
jgi:hypothetical protein